MQKKVNQILLSKKKKFISISSENFKSETDFLNNVAELLNSGADVIELKEKNLPTSEIIKLGKKLRDLTAVFNALLIIYDRIDVAKLTGADGISLDENTMSVEEAIKLTEGNILIGCYSDTVEQANIAEESGADFVVTTKSMSELNIRIFKI